MNKQTVITALLAIVTMAVWDKDNFKMTGRIEGAGNDTLCIEYVILQPEKQVITHKVAVKNGEFSFSAKLREAYYGTMFLKSNPQEILSTYFVPDEEAIFNGRMNPIEEYWSGTTFYQQYGRIMDVQRPFNVEFAAARNEPDSIRSLKNREINILKNHTYMKYIEEHPDEDATATLVVYVGYDQVLAAIDKLTPKVRNGRMKTDLDKMENTYKQRERYTC